MRGEDYEDAYIIEKINALSVNHANAFVAKNAPLLASSFALDHPPLTGDVLQK